MQPPYDAYEATNLTFQSHMLESLAEEGLYKMTYLSVQQFKIVLIYCIVMCT